MRAETCGRSQPRDRQEIHRLQRKMANRMQFYASTASIRQSHTSVPTLQRLWLSDDPSQIERTPAASLLPALLRDKSWSREILFRGNGGSSTNREWGSVGYLKLLLLSRTSKKVKDAKNIRITSDTM